MNAYFSLLPDPTGKANEWNPEQDETLICRHIRKETHDVTSFFFSSPSSALFRFDPGQFFNFEITTASGESFTRSYTISSSPTRPHLISITVKRTATGPVSNWLHENLTVGDQIKARGPLGTFTCRGSTSPRLLLLGAGSGITPLMSMLRAHSDLVIPRDVLFVQFARTSEDIIFEKELDLISSQSVSLKAISVCEVTSDGTHPFSGRIRAELLERLAPDFQDREIYCCGPLPFMEKVKEILRERKFRLSRYNEESFVFEPTEPASITQPALGHSDGFSVTFSRSNKEVTCPPDVSILNAAAAAGLRLPSSCTKGVCGTCKVHMLQGQVDMQHGGGIRQREIDKGMILLCCSKPKTDIVIDK